MSILSEVEEIVREMGPIIAADVVKLMPHVTPQQAYARLWEAENKGSISSTFIPNPDSANARNREIKQYSYGGKPQGRRMKRVRPTPAAVAHNADELRHRIAELEEWKADAIKRFPDLAVDPEIIQARKIVHKMLIDSGDRNLAADVIGGRKDKTMVVRAVVAALSERN